jgi:hypothetical protein
MAYERVFDRRCTNDQRFSLISPRKREVDEAPFLVLLKVPHACD